MADFFTEWSAARQYFPGVMIFVGKVSFMQPFAIRLLSFARFILSVGDKFWSACCAFAVYDAQNKKAIAPANNWNILCGVQMIKIFPLLFILGSAILAVLKDDEMLT